MQILSNNFKGEVYENKEVGLSEVFFEKEFLDFSGKIEAYELHKLSLNVDENFFSSYALSDNSKTIQAIKHNEKPFYGVLFHPEVRNKKLIENFCKLSN